MKKMLYSIWFSVTLLTSSALSVSCEAVDELVSVSSEADSDVIDLLYKRSSEKLEPIIFEYLTIKNKYFYHSNFETNIGVFLIQDGRISESDFKALNNKNQQFISDLAKASNVKPVNEAAYIYDFTGITLTLENSFVEDLFFNFEDEKLEPQVQVKTVMALTISNGWKKTGKILLDFMTTDNYYLASSGKVFDFINSILVNSIDNSLKIKNKEKINEFEIITSKSDIEEIIKNYELAAEKLGIDNSIEIEKFVFKDDENLENEKGFTVKLITKANNIKANYSITSV
ncbi:hypothetical protein SSABA_v1c05100 [Spiroplasma sabaudiense Ar-1343]|uniref:Lipoprotein n=1 Tax=Spiroplasma sabaudiense Ar-1343 TaxID=1276257 RepID=W6AA32_9MOLU|nr:hypothetical protein [Spiroplasma sabaudiense]AHI53917.1 hypothetical protein SSABA_v1c05100 [Spiroplasma sabaudiense Ar-1343]